MCRWDMRVRQNQFEEILFGYVTKFDLFDLEEVKEGRALKLDQRVSELDLRIR